MIMQLKSRFFSHVKKNSHPKSETREVQPILIREFKVESFLGMIAHSKGFSLLHDAIIVRN